MSRSNSNGRENHPVTTSIPLISQFVLQRISRFHRVSSVVSSSGSVHRCNRFRSAIAVRGWRKGVTEGGKRGGKGKSLCAIFRAQHARERAMRWIDVYCQSYRIAYMYSQSLGPRSSHTFPYPFLLSSMKNSPKAVKIRIYANGITSAYMRYPCQLYR